MSEYWPRRRQTCQCCGERAASMAVGMPDQSGHIWTHHLCCRCVARCDYDDNGNPVCSRVRPNIEGNQ